jgi:hypothetical protein
MHIKAREKHCDLSTEREAHIYKGPGLEHSSAGIITSPVGGESKYSECLPCLRAFRIVDDASFLQNC